MARLLVTSSVLLLGVSYLAIPAQAVETPLTMGTASTYGVLASTGVTSATPSSITGTAGGNLGVGDATPVSGTISISGTQNLGGTSLTALSAASTALADNRAGVATVVELGAGRTITPGAYDGGTLEVNGTLTLDGGGVSSSVFIFRSAATLITGVGSNVLLTNGAQACNVFWQVGSSATLGASSTMRGHVIAQASVSTGATSTVYGQLIAVTGAVTLGGTTIQNDSCVTPTPTPTATPAPVATQRPVQISVLSSCSTVATEISTIGGVYVIQGTFPRTVTQVSINDQMLPGTAWTGTPTEVTIQMPAHDPGPVRVVLYNTTVGALTPDCLVNYTLPPATLHIVKNVINTFGGTSNSMSFTIHVMQNGIDVPGSPASSMGSTGSVYTLAPGDYNLYEVRVPGYRGIWSGPISLGGMITLTTGQNVTVTRTNFDMNPTPGAFIYVDTSTATTPPTPPTPTESGGVLPNTSTPWGNELILGSGLVLIGALGFTMRKFLAR